MEAPDEPITPTHGIGPSRRAFWHGARRASLLVKDRMLGANPVLFLVLETT